MPHSFSKTEQLDSISDAIHRIRLLLDNYSDLLEEEHIKQDLQNLKLWVERFSTGSAQAERIIATHEYEELATMHLKLKASARDHSRISDESPAIAPKEAREKTEDLTRIYNELDAVIDDLLIHIKPTIILSKES